MSVHVVALPPPHHYRTASGKRVAGWVANSDGKVYAVVYDPQAGRFVWVDEPYELGEPDRGTHTPFERYMPDDPRRGADT